MRDRVEGDLLGELLRLHHVIHIDAAGLVEQLVHAGLARARSRLIGRHHDAAHAKGVVHRLQRHDELGGRAVRVGDDVAPAIRRKCAFDRVGVHLRHDQRHVVFHAEGGRVVDDDATGLACLRGDGLGSVATRREQGDVGLAEIELVERADGQHVILAIGHLAPGRARRGERMHLVRRKIPLGKCLQHLASDSAGGADNSNSVSHLYPRFPPA